MIDDFRRRFWISLALTIPILALSPMVMDFIGLEGAIEFAGQDYVLLALSTAIFFYGGWPFLTGLWFEVRAGRPGMMTLIGLAITVAYVYSAAVVLGVPGGVFFWELATLIDIMLLGHWVEMRSVAGASSAIEALVKLLPATAHRLRPDGSEEDVPASALAKGDRIRVRPGERVPADGVIESGASSFDESMLTGESVPVARAEGAAVIAGAINGDGAVTLSITRTGSETYLAQVVELVRQAEASRSRTQDLANRAALWLTYIAIGAGFLTLAVWLILGDPFDYALERMVTVMIITCPHALGLAIPLVVAVSTALTAQSGVLVRDRTAFERGREIHTIVFDKTGTLTEGRFGVTAIVPRADVSEAEILAYAAALEAQSEHPIARGIVAHAKERGVAAFQATGFRNLAGRGATASVLGRKVEIVSPGELRSRAIEPDDPRLEAPAAAGNTIVHLLLDGRLVGSIALADVIRPEARAAIAELKAMGIASMILTGDSATVARAVASELGVDRVFAEVLPADKAAKVREIKAGGRKVAMVGDGVNDAPALVEADLGIAIGAGTDVAIDAADVILVRSDPRDVVAALKLSRATYAKMVQNLFWATGYNAAAIPLAAGVGAPIGIVLSPAVGAVLMSVSTVVVAINAVLLRRARRLVAR
ncbi:MAG: heavy metal translocating P-type ATPase [Bauldia sp.]|nr:heavy metal translocating P-type ATPase [Bauldia sp.]